MCCQWMLRSKRVTSHDRSRLREARPAQADSYAGGRNVARLFAKQKRDPISLFRNFVSKDTRLLFRYWNRVFRNQRQINPAVPVEIRRDQISTIVFQRHAQQMRHVREMCPILI